MVQLLGLLDNNHSDNVRLAAVGALLNLAVEDECKTSTIFVSVRHRGK